MVVYMDPLGDLKSTGAYRVQKCRNLIKKPWAVLGVPYMSPTTVDGQNPALPIIRNIP